MGFVRHSPTAVEFHGQLQHWAADVGKRCQKEEPPATMVQPPWCQPLRSVLGEKELQRYLVGKIQEVYRSQAVAINDKHCEVIVRQMMRSVKIQEVGDTNFLIDEQVARFRFQEENDRVTTAGGKPVESEARWFTK